MFLPNGDLGALFTYDPYSKLDKANYKWITNVVFVGLIFALERLDTGVLD